MKVLKKVFSILNALIKKGFWFNNIKFQDCRKFWGFNTFNTDVINLGSTSAVCAFDYNGIPLKCFNWALSINPLLGDMAILKNYYSYLKEGASIIIPLCPFSSLAGCYSITEDRYYTLLYPSSIPGYSIRRHNQIKKEMNFPLFYYPIWNLLTDLKQLIHRKGNRVLSDEEMKDDANNRMNNWMKEFSINSFSDPLTLVNLDAINDAAQILNNIIGFCKERNLTPYLLIPPVYHSLGLLFTPDLKTKVIDQLVNRIEDKSIWFHNYMNDPDFCRRKDLFRNSFLLNSKGAKLFTKRVLADLELYGV